MRSAYCVSLVIYQFGALLFDGASFGVGTVAAILVVVLFVYLLARPAKKSGSETLSSVAAREQAS